MTTITEKKQEKKWLSHSEFKTPNKSYLSSQVGRTVIPKKRNKYAFVVDWQIVTEEIIAE